jgi:hypothetical protein
MNESPVIWWLRCDLRLRENVRRKLVRLQKTPLTAHKEDSWASGLQQHFSFQH